MRKGPATVWLLVAVLLLGQVSVFPASEASASERSFAAGSLIIPMDTTYQNYGMWKAYGLVNELLLHGIPVAWAIAPDKSFGGIDFTATTQDYRTAAGPTTVNYTGGPFIIEAAFAAQAQPIIQAWWAKYANQPTVHEATSPFTANVDIVLKSPPRIALEATNANIAMAYFNAAGITDLDGNAWTTASPNVLDQLEIVNGGLFTQGDCSQRKFDIFVTPHNGGYSYSLTDPLNLGTRTYAQLDYFVNQGGGWLALCHSILSNENAIADLYNNSSPAVRSLFTASGGGGFLTRTGFTTIANKAGTWTVGEPELPLAQAVPTTVLQALPGGSVQTWDRTSVSYFDQTERVASFITPTNTYDWAINGVAHDGTTLGKVTFLGGHSYATSLPYTSNYEAPYLRFFFNALFFNGGAVAKLDLAVTSQDIPQGLTSVVVVSLLNTGSSVAEGTQDVTIRLPQGVTYVETVAGYPAPLSVTTDPVTNATVLTWGSSLGNIPGGETATQIRVSLTPDTLGDTYCAHLDARYGDVYGESFTASLCRTVNVYPAADLEITKTLNAPSSEMYAGSLAEWTLSFRNTGDADLLDGVVEDLLPLGYAYKSSSLAPSSVLQQPDGTTRIRWNVGTVVAKAGARTITMSAFAPSDPGQYTNTVTLTGPDWAGFLYQASAASDVEVIPPPIQLRKSVSPEGDVEVTTPGQVLTYTLRPHYSGAYLLQNALVSDATRAYTTYVAGSANAGGTLGFTPLPEEDGDDAEMRIALTASPTAVPLGGEVTVTMTLTNKTGTARTLDLSVLEALDGATLTGPTSATVAANSTFTLTYTATMTSIGERVFEAQAENVTLDYSSHVALSNTVLVTSHLNASPSNDVVTWRLGSNTPPVPGETILTGYPAGVYAFRGGNKKEFSKYRQATDVWQLEAQPTNGIEKGGALTVDSATGTIYASEGNSKWFYEYSITTNTWTRLTDASANFNEGGGIQFLQVGGVKYVFAVLGNGTAFRRYNIATDNWTNLANVPVTVKRGGAITTDGTYLYVLQGDGKKGFYRYDVSANTWTAMAPTPANVSWGGALTSVDTNGDGAIDSIYALQGDGKTGFWRYSIATNTWTAMAVTPGAVKAGGALTNDGQYIYALQGGTALFWGYSVADNAWTALQPTNFTGSVGEGGALVFDPGVSPTGYFTQMSASAALITSEETITVQLAASSSYSVGGVVPGPMTITSTGGASAVLVSGPTLVSADDHTSGISDYVVYEWVYRGMAGSGPGTLTFVAGATGTSPDSTFPEAKTLGIIVSPELTFQVRVFDADQVPDYETQIVNTGMISDRAALGYGLNSNAVTNMLIRPRLSIAKSNDPMGLVHQGDEITYRVVIRNDGTGPAHNIVITDPIPQYTTYVPGSAAIQSTDVQSVGQVTEPADPGSPLLATLDRLGSDQSATLTFRVRVDDGLSPGSYQIPNTATVTAAIVPPLTSNTVNNQVDVVPSFSLEKIASVERVTNVGEAIEYTVLVTNTGDAALHNLTVNDPMLPGLAPVLGTDAVHNVGDIDNDGVLDVMEMWYFTGSYTVTESDIDNGPEGYTMLTNTVTADTDETDPETASADVMLDIAFSSLTIAKSVLPGAGYDTPDQATPFIIRVVNEERGYSTDVVLTDGQAVEVMAPRGTFSIKEIAVPVEYRLTGDVTVTRYVDGVPQESFALGSDSLLDVQPGSDYRVTFTNRFEHLLYFHSSSRAVNTFAPGGVLP
ncbi:MAG: DUF11 domain-containing protein [Coriobacteriia bacterium]|nr:DUF11 domain-containing protein [Coriobacteriia bacterium]